MSEIGQKVIAAVRLAAAERPDYVYERDNGACKYIRDGAPSCLVGQGLWSAGLIDSDWDGDNADSTGILIVVAKHEWPLDPHEAVWLDRVQDWQDAGFPWGEAVAVADRQVVL